MRPWSVTNCRSRLMFLKSSASAVKSILGFGRGVRISTNEPLRPPRRSGLSGRVLRGINYLISRWSVCRRKAGLYFLSSSFSVFSFLLRVVVYREGDLPSFRASVHSMVMISRAMKLFFLFRLFFRLVFFGFGFGNTDGVNRPQNAEPALSQRALALQLGLSLNREARPGDRL